MDWADFIRKLGGMFGWTAGDVLDGMTFAEFWAVCLNSGERAAPHSPGAMRDKINRLRAAKGLPPMKPAPKKG